MYAHIDDTTPAAARPPSWCMKLWCNLWSSSIEANTRSLIGWQLFFMLVDVGSAVYSFAVDHRLEAPDIWGLINDAIALPVIMCLILIMWRRHHLCLGRLFWVFVGMTAVYLASVVYDVVDLITVRTGPRSKRVVQSVIILVNDLCFVWLWGNLCYFVPLLQRAWCKDEGAAEEEEGGEEAAAGVAGGEARAEASVRVDRSPSPPQEPVQPAQPAQPAAPSVYYQSGLLGGRAVGADEARWEDEQDAKFCDDEGQEEVKRSRSGS